MAKATTTPSCVFHKWDKEVAVHILSSRIQALGPCAPAAHILTSCVRAHGPCTGVLLLLTRHPADESLQLEKMQALAGMARWRSSTHFVAFFQCWGWNPGKCFTTEPHPFRVLHS